VRGRVEEWSWGLAELFVRIKKIETYSVSSYGTCAEILYERTTTRPHLRANDINLGPFTGTVAQLHNLSY